MYEHVRTPNCSTVALHHHCCSDLMGSHAMNSAKEQSGLPRMKPTSNVIKYPSMQVDNLVHRRGHPADCGAGADPQDAPGSPGRDGEGHQDHPGAAAE